MQDFIDTLSASPTKLVWTGPKVMTKAWGLKVYPATVVLDSKHRVIESLLGYTEKNTQRLERLLIELSK